jgi:hypothetical protein
VSDRSDELEKELMSLKDGRLITKYCTKLVIRWPEAEDIIRESIYAWNYCQQCLRSMPLRKLIMMCVGSCVQKIEEKNMPDNVPSKTLTINIIETIEDDIDDPNSDGEDFGGVDIKINNEVNPREIKSLIAEKLREIKGIEVTCVFN